MLQFNSDSSSTSSPHMSLSRVYENGLYDDMPSISPRLSNHFRSIAHMDRISNDNASLNYFLEKASGCSSTAPTPSTGTLISKSVAEMIKEIATLEVEIIHLERYLLSLYRTSFKNHLATLSFTALDQSSRSHPQCKTGSPLQELVNHSCCREARDNVGMQRSGRVQHNPTASTCGPTNNQNSPPPLKEKSKRGSGLRSLADHLGASLLDQICDTPDKLSEEIVRCMTAIYCKLASTPRPYIGLSASSSSPSLSSSNTFSPQDLHDNWSPRCSEGTAEYPCQPAGLKENSGPYATMVEVSKICLDDERLNYVASMLQNFRSMVGRLEKVDPRKMNREEKLTFWINIHNALVMHAYLAYGVQHNRIRSTSLILKAAYNVGGHSISAHVIQSSILGCRPHRSASLLQAFFTPGTKSGGSRHTYALDYQESLVYFALCSGAYSDPAVRVYTAKNIFKELNIAKQEFVQSRVVSICKEGTHKKFILLPKILHYFAKDASLNLYGLLEMVHACLTEAQRKALEGCRNGGKPDKCIEWSPYNSAFRYVINP